MGLPFFFVRLVAHKLNSLIMSSTSNIAYVNGTQIVCASPQMAQNIMNIQAQLDALDGGPNESTGVSVTCTVGSAAAAINGASMVRVTGWDSDNNRPIVDNISETFNGGPGFTEDVFGVYGAQYIAFTGAEVEITIFGRCILRVDLATAGDTVYQQQAAKFACTKDAAINTYGIAEADLTPVGVVIDAEDKYTGSLYKEIFFNGFIAK